MDWNSAFKKISELELLSIIDMQKVLHQSSAHQRYNVFCEHYPNLAHHLKDKDIASFLGMTKHTFSRIKNRF